MNVCGKIYEIPKSLLQRFPETLLGDESQLSHHYSQQMDCLYFDKNRHIFEAIIFYYQTRGQLYRPRHIPMEIFVQEAGYFKIPENHIRKLQIREGYFEIPEDKDIVLPGNNFRRKVWRLLEYPNSGLFARLFGFVSIVMIFLSVIAFCAETLPEYHDQIHSNITSCTIITKNITTITTHERSVTFTTTTSTHERGADTSCRTDVGLTEEKQAVRKVIR